MLLKVDVPNLVLDLQWTLIFKWCMVGCDTERSPKRHAQTLLTNLSAILGITGRTYTII